MDSEGEEDGDGGSADAEARSRKLLANSGANRQRSRSLSEPREAPLSRARESKSFTSVEGVLFRKRQVQKAAVAMAFSRLWLERRTSTA